MEPLAPQPPIQPVPQSPESSRQSQTPSSPIIALVNNMVVLEKKYQEPTTHALLTTALCITPDYLQAAINGQLKEKAQCGLIYWLTSINLAISTNKAGIPQVTMPLETLIACAICSPHRQDVQELKSKLQCAANHLLSMTANSPANASPKQQLLRAEELKQQAIEMQEACLHLQNQTMQAPTQRKDVQLKCLQAEVLILCLQLAEQYSSNLAQIYTQQGLPHLPQPQPTRRLLLVNAGASAASSASSALSVSQELVPLAPQQATVAPPLFQPFSQAETGAAGGAEPTTQNQPTETQKKKKRICQMRATSFYSKAPELEECWSSEEFEEAMEKDKKEFDENKDKTN